MTQLNIAGKVVQVDDSFLKLSPDDQGKTVDEIAGQIGAKAPDAVADVGQGRTEGVQMLRGVPIAGAYADKAAAALNAAAQPIMETGMSKAPTFGARMAENEQRLKAAGSQYEEQHPIASSVEQLAGGTAAMAPLAASSVAARALGMSGTLPQMVSRGALSGAAIGAVDAAARGEDVGRGAEVNAIAGAGLPVAGRLIGKAVRALRPGEAVRPNPTVDVNGTAVPQFESQITGDNLAGSREQAALSGALGPEAQRVAQEAFDARTAATEQARQQVSDRLSAATNPDLGAPAPAPGEPSQVATPHTAGDQVITELAQQHNDQIQQNALRGISGEVSDFQTRAGMVPPGADQQILTPTARDATGSLQQNLQETARAQAAQRTAAYKTAGEVPGEFKPDAFEGVSKSVEQRLNSGAPENRVRVNANTPRAAEALQLIESEIGSGRRPTNLAEPRPPAPEPGAPRAPSPDDHAATVAALRRQYGDTVADAYNRQHAPAVPAPAAAPQPGAQSLLEFLASKGGLGPDQELNAIGAHNHTVNVEGAGRRRLVKQGGWPLDYAREAAEEAGYLQPGHNGTSTVNDLLDAIDAEVRGQKRYPEGLEGHKTGREQAAMSERERAEYDRHAQAMEEDLSAAGHGDLGPEVKQRAVKLMAERGMDADTAVEHALHQLETEDAASHSSFPGDRKPPPAAPTTAAPAQPITGRDVETVRQLLVPLMRDANAAARMPGGSAADSRAMRRIMDAFDQHVREMVQGGGFSGNGEELLARQTRARQLHQQFRQNFSSRGSGDIVGPQMERIIGKHPGQEMTPEAFADSLFGNQSGTGGNKQVALAQHVRGIVGPDSAQWAATKQGVLSHLLDVPEGNAALSPAKRADRINEFVNGKGNSLAQVFFSPEERRRLVAHADVLRSLVPHEGPPTAVDRQILRLSGADGHPPATSRDAVDMLFTGDGTKAGSVQLAKRLKAGLSPETWDSVRQAMWSHLTTKPQGMTEFGPQALSQRLSKFLSEPMAEVLYSSKERQMMRILQEQYKSMVPLPNTTNPSGSGIFAAKMVNAAKGNLLPMLGLATHGVGGVLAGAAANKALAFVSNRRTVNQAKDLFYGKAAKAAVNPAFERAAAIAAKAAMPLIGGQ